MKKRQQRRDCAGSIDIRGYVGRYNFRVHELRIHENASENLKSRNHAAAADEIQQIAFIMIAEDLPAHFSISHAPNLLKADSSPKIC